MKSSSNFKIARMCLVIASALGTLPVAPTAWAQANGYP